MYTLISTVLYCAILIVSVREELMKIPRTQKVEGKILNIVMLTYVVHELENEATALLSVSAPEIITI